MTRFDVTRSTGWIVLAVAALGPAALAPAPARACWQCDGVTCVSGEAGARACFLGFGGCTTTGNCGEGRGPGTRIDAAASTALQLTWIDAGAAASGPRLVRDVGRRAFGPAAVRALRAAGGWPGGDAPVVAAAAGLGDEWEVALRGADGDGVVLAWSADGRGGRVTVRAFEAGHAGAVLAQERLGDSDALVVPVRHGGRPHALVVQPRVLPRLSLRLETADLVRSARDAVRGGRARLAIEVAATAD